MPVISVKCIFRGRIPGQKITWAAQYGRGIAIGFVATAIDAGRKLLLRPVRLFDRYKFTLQAGKSLQCHQLGQWDLGQRIDHTVGQGKVHVLCHAMGGNDTFQPGALGRGQPVERIFDGNSMRRLHL